jgi:O-antigen ligase
MTEAMAKSAPLQALDRRRFVRAADGLAILLAITIPWSTSAAGICAALYVIAVLPTLDAGSLRAVKATPALWLPVALVGFGALGMLWADVAWAERLDGFEPMAKLLVLPLAMLHFRQSERSHWVIAAFLASCTVLLAVSLVPLAVPSLRWMWHKDYGVPVKDYIVQSGEFLIGAFAVLYLAVDRIKAGRRGAAVGLLVLAALFVVSILYVNTGRTALATLPVLLLVFGVRLFGWKGLVGAVLAGLVIGAIAWASSSYLRERTTGVIGEAQIYQAEDAKTPTGLRLEFWKKSIRFIAEAPLIGHGTGSIESQFRKAAAGTTGASSLVTTNPHNQTLMTGVQLGAAGIALLWAMWIAHLILFRGEGFIAWFGLLVTLQIMVGSLFNSLLSDFTQGWTYVLLVGAAGGAMLRAARAGRDGDAR